mmetsp:Transcript_16066/g.16196  ORF Transcript_16066/g.16196 Transcript_16066/m.16196 type:complete len:360 (+) Transcript_16066:38-1117(+)
MKARMAKLVAFVIYIVAFVSHFSYSYFFSRTSITRRAFKVMSTTPANDRDTEREKIFSFFRKVMSISSLPSINVAQALDTDNKVYQNPMVNIQSDDFWYPPYMLGVWNTTLSFRGATFTKKIPYEVLTSSDALPGFAPYSIIFTPDTGKDANMLRRYVELDSHPREDHPFNIRQLITSFLPNTVVDSAAYSFQKAPDWFHSPSNHWQIKYHDDVGEGLIDLLTRRRNTSYFSGSIQTIEFFRQSHRRHVYNSSVQPQPRTRVDDYALSWKLSIPAALRNEFVSTEELSSSKQLVGSLDILGYLPPSNDLYLEVPAEPAVVYSYDVKMDRTASNSSTESTRYPFVWRDDGPVELNQYFGY